MLAGLLVERIVTEHPGQGSHNPLVDMKLRTRPPTHGVGKLQTHKSKSHNVKFRDLPMLLLFKYHGLNHLQQMQSAY